MYNKLFTKILDSSIWMETTPTRIVWLTLIAAMDEHGIVHFASVANLAHRAIVSIEEAQKAVDCLESPDPNSADPDHDGRRIERIEGGWLVLNAHKYRELVTKAVIQEQTRKRVAAYRARNANVTKRNENVTTSEAVSKAKSETLKDSPQVHKKRSPASTTNQSDLDWFNSLKSNPAYKHIDLDAENGKIDAWLSVNPSRLKTRKFIVNWLNRIAPPVNGLPVAPKMGNYDSRTKQQRIQDNNNAAINEYARKHGIDYRAGDLFKRHEPDIGSIPDAREEFGSDGDLEIASG